LPYHHVLAVYDGTAASEDLLEVACNIARSQHARLTILHVRLVPLTETLPTYERGTDPEIDALVARAEQFAEKRGVKAAGAVHFARTVGGGALDEARTRGVDLLALLAPDRDRLQSLDSLGTDIEVVLRRAACAVMLVRPKA